MSTPKIGDTVLLDVYGLGRTVTRRRAFVLSAEPIEGGTYFTYQPARGEYYWCSWGAAKTTSKTFIGIETAS